MTWKSRCSIRGMMFVQIGSSDTNMIEQHLCFILINSVKLMRLQDICVVIKVTGCQHRLVIIDHESIY